MLLQGAAKGVWAAAPGMPIGTRETYWIADSEVIATGTRDTESSQALEGNGGGEAAWENEGRGGAESGIR